VSGQSNAQATDRDHVLALHQAYLKANEKIDPSLLEGVWDDDPGNIFYNLNGFTYTGLAHWSRLWKYFSPRMEQIVPYTSYDQRVVIEGDVAWITASRFGETRWIGTEPPPRPDGPVMSRSTEVLMRTPDGWRVVHTHFSRGSLSPRPGDI
jgi:ketosteroid isomerase-like protein